MTHTNSPAHRTASAIYLRNLWYAWAVLNTLRRPTVYLTPDDVAALVDISYERIFEAGRARHAANDEYARIYPEADAIAFRRHEKHLGAARKAIMSIVAGLV